MTVHDSVLDTSLAVPYPEQLRLRTPIWSDHMTYAIVETGGKQYRVAPGDLLDIDRFDGEKGSAVEWTNVLLYRKEDGPVVGNPLVPNVKVMGTVVHGPSRSLRKNAERITSAPKDTGNTSHVSALMRLPRIKVTEWRRYGT